VNSIDRDDGPPKLSISMDLDLPLSFSKEQPIAQPSSPITGQLQDERAELADLTAWGTPIISIPFKAHLYIH
jgi:hypothetical protein